MKHLTLEIYPAPDSREISVWRSAPAFGDSHAPAAGSVQHGVLNDGVHRVKFAVFNAMLPLSTIQDVGAHGL